MGGLIAVGVVGLRGRIAAQSQVSQLLAKGLAGDPQEPGGLMLVAIGKPVHEREERAVEFSVNQGVEIVGSRLELLVDERF